MVCKGIHDIKKSIPKALEDSKSYCNALFLFENMHRWLPNLPADEVGEGAVFNRPMAISKGFRKALPCPYRLEPLPTYLLRLSLQGLRVNQRDPRSQIYHILYIFNHIHTVSLQAAAPQGL